jgi:hypothetical protein
MHCIAASEVCFWFPICRHCPLYCSAGALSRNGQSGLDVMTARTPSTPKHHFPDDPADPRLLSKGRNLAWSKSSTSHGASAGTHDDRVVPFENTDDTLRNRSANEEGDRMNDLIYTRMPFENIGGTQKRPRNEEEGDHVRATQP